MIINLDSLKQLDPDKDFLEKYSHHYKIKEFTPNQFLGLKNISHADKLWVAFRLMPQYNITLAAADIAEMVLPLYEIKFPNDARPRKAIEAARSDHSNATFIAMDAAIDAAAPSYAFEHGVAEAAANAAAVSCTDSQDWAAAYAEHTARAAASVISYTGKPASPYVNPDVSLREQHEKLIRKIILKYWNNKGKSQ